MPYDGRYRHQTSTNGWWERDRCQEDQEQTPGCSRLVRRSDDRRSQTCDECIGQTSKMKSDATANGSTYRCSNSTTDHKVHFQWNGLDNVGNFFTYILGKWMPSKIVFCCLNSSHAVLPSTIFAETI
jgi:hypothetical protein